MYFPGSLIPSYPSGHALVAGACVTTLKAYFDEFFTIPNSVMVDSNPPPTIPGTTLVNFVGLFHELLKRLGPFLRL